ncbi:hypothetical protein BEWA_021280 [Theileria equi strain WA]|uniref:Uncharacterized protein n=1 Tax=Theileria equi strain WA TaxID=1537102 RepID=L0AUQ2_THEEQ|nr:hypothetical protein BEWA_021280 [Theileria equi strain WA]AFZ79280.1 hypothetical protein BEWA_021280 [Theileria equi strain WA]|eukprot:XP_004828946.1 hypothetical protein BEWA_021280 [Theileria equi strain WA]
MTGAKSSFIDEVRHSLGSKTVEWCMLNKTTGKGNVTFDLLKEAPGNKGLLFELYLVHYVENIESITTTNEQFSKALAECFHELAMDHHSLPDASNNKLSFVNDNDLLKGDFIAKRIGAVANLIQSKDVDTGNILQPWSNRLSIIYIIFRHTGILDFKLHCKGCAAFSEVLNTSVFSSIIFILSLLKKPSEAEHLFNSIFYRISSSYWNNDLLMMNFSTKMVKGLVSDSLNLTIGLSDLYVRMNEILLSFLAYGNFLSFVRLSFSTSLVRLLASFSLNLALYNAQLDSTNNSTKSHIHNVALSVILNHVFNVVKHSNDESFNSLGSIYKNFGFKNINYGCTEWIIIGYFIESYISLLSALLSQGISVNQNWDPSLMSAFIDTDTFEWISNLKFENDNSDGIYECRVAVMVLYATSLYHQIPIMRVNDICYMRLLYSLPWLSAIKYCTKDVGFHYMLPKLLKSVVKSFGEEILINNSRYDPISLLLFTKITGFSGPLFHTKDSLFFNAGYSFYNSFSLQKFFHKSLSALSKKIHSIPSQSPELDLVYTSICNILPRFNSLFYNIYQFSGDLRPEIPTSLNLIEWKWFSQSIRTMYSSNETVLYLSIMDFLVYYYFMGYEKDLNNQESNLTRKNLGIYAFLNTNEKSDDKIETQRIISSNFVALHQNPINLLLRIPHYILFQLFKFRLFGNLIILMSSTLTKYIYDGFSNFYNTTRLEMDPLQLCRLQDFALINLISECSSNVTSKETDSQFRSLLYIISSKNSAISQLILSHGLPLDVCTKLEDLKSEMSMINAVERYTASIKLLSSDAAKEPEWKRDISIQKVQDFLPQSLGPFDLADVTIFNLYVIFLISMDFCDLSKEYNTATTGGINITIKHVIDLFLECIQVREKGDILIRFITNAIPLILKLHYIFHGLARNSIVVLNDWLVNNEDKTKEMYSQILNMKSVLEAIDYNDIVMKNDS